MPESTTSITVFCSYAPADEPSFLELEKHLSLLRRQGIIATWHRRDIAAGTDWTRAIDEQLGSAAVILLLISPDFIASDYYYGVELQRAMARHDAGEARVIPVLLRPGDLTGAPFERLAPLPSNEKPITTWPDRDEAWTNVVAGIRRAINSRPLIPATSSEPRNPYKGLNAFTQKDVEDFFGREAVVEKLVKLVESLVTATSAPVSKRLLTILGPSGSGKSSVVMAGLLPRLQQGTLPGSQDWLYLEPLKPGQHPLEALASTLKPHFPDTSFTTLREDLEDPAARGLHLLATHLAKQRETSTIVLLVDQCEELFTQTESEDERQHFIHLLLTACNEPGGPLFVLLTLRADFYDRIMHYPDLFRLIDTLHVSLLSIEPENLRRVIEQPATLPNVQVTFEDDLAHLLLFEVQGQVGALPLLQFTLDQLFQMRSGRQLTLSAYRELGGVKGALAKQAEDTYKDLPSDKHRELARVLFMRLIDPGMTEQDSTRRRAILSEFSLSQADQTRLLQEVIDAFLRRRLLTTNEKVGTTTIEVSHEALIREWPRLAKWLRDAHDDIALQQTISKDVTEWERHGKGRDRLYRGAQLKEAQAWAKRNTSSSNEDTFLRASTNSQRKDYFFMAALFLTFALILGRIAQPLLLQGFTQLLYSIVPTPLTVTSPGDSGPGSLRQAIALAKPGDLVRFDPRLTGETITLTSNDLTIDKNLTILGPDGGTLTISGNSAAYHIHVVQGVTVTLSNLIITLFNSSGIKNEGTLTLLRSTVSRNKTIGNGGGIENFFTGTLTLRESVVSDNAAIAPGTQENFIANPVFENGGGIYNQGKLTLVDSVVSGNTAFKYGGGIVNGQYLGSSDEQDKRTATAILINSTISENAACAGGGGIYNGAHRGAADLMLSNSTISRNKVGICSHDAALPASGTGSGGGIYTTELANTITITNSTIVDNTTSNGSGGGIFDSFSRNGRNTLTITNSTVSNNTASGNGGGMTFSGSQANIIFCTIYQNGVAHAGGGISIDNDTTSSPPAPSSVTMRNSLVAGNHADTGSDIAGSLTTDGYNLIENASDISFNDPNNKSSSDKVGISPSDLRIDTVQQENGGPTQTIALFQGSPALDAIPLAACQIKDIFSSQSHLYTDQRGKKRPDGNERLCDIGAYEMED